MIFSSQYTVKTWLESLFRQGRKPCLFGILNVTPDSFSDGGMHFSTQKAIAFAKQLLADGADAIDIGGESTRPGADAVPAEEEIRRICPVVRALKQDNPDIVISVDTRKAAVADCALSEGADIVNDVSGLRHDSELPKVAAIHRAGLIVMHSKAEPANMQNEKFLRYGDMVEDVRDFLLNATGKALNAGVEHDNILLDPGIGFAKSREQNFELIRRTPEFLSMGFPLFYGISRKSFLAEKEVDLKTRDEISAEYHVRLAKMGVSCLRLHHPAITLEALKKGNIRRCF